MARTPPGGVRLYLLYDENIKRYNGKAFIVRHNVRLGNDVMVGDGVILGEGDHLADKELVIGDGARIRSHTVIYAGTTIGKSFQTGHGALIREGNVIGDRVSIGSHSVVERDNRIGDGVRVHSNCFIPEFITIEKKAWLGPGVTILNVLHPPCPKFEECAKGTIIGAGAKIGGNVTIGPRVRIGRQALIGAGSVVLKDVPDRAVAYGNPARVRNDIDGLKCVLGEFDRVYSWEE
jgi:acetyltransferase-like isoleucine patch superfamily enzyme